MLLQHATLATPVLCAARLDVTTFDRLVKCDQANDEGVSHLGAYTIATAHPSSLTLHFLLFTHLVDAA